MISKVELCSSSVTDSYDSFTHEVACLVLNVRFVIIDMRACQVLRSTFVPTLSRNIIKDAWHNIKM